MDYHIIYTLVYMDGFLAAKHWAYKVVSHIEWLLYYGMDKIVYSGTKEECEQELITLNNIS